MSRVLVTESLLEDIGDAIRSKNGSSDTYTLEEMVDAITAIETNSQDRLWILNPDIMDQMYNATGNPTNTNIQYLPYVSKIKNNATNSTWNGYSRQSFNSVSNVCVVYRGGYEVGGMQIPIKIPGSTYSKLSVYVQVTSYGSGWPQAHIVLTNTLGINNDGTISSGLLKSITLVNSGTSDSAINSQTGVVINSVNKLLSAQVVEVDISNIDEDFYIGFWNCDRNIYIRSIYLDV